ncbi:hypothetical protein GCM10020216_019460 [Nonomuraea helvata]
MAAIMASTRQAMCGNITPPRTCEDAGFRAIPQLHLHNRWETLSVTVRLRSECGKGFHGSDGSPRYPAPTAAGKPFEPSFRVPVGCRRPRRSEDRGQDRVTPPALQT